MFYSDYEIYFMAKCHGRELRRLRENFQSKARNEKSKNLVRLLHGLIVKIPLIPHRNQS